MFDSIESFALRVKYEKHTVREGDDASVGLLPMLILALQLFLPVEPSTSYENVLSNSLSLLAKSDATPPKESRFASFDEMHAADASLFQASTHVAGGAMPETLRFMEIDRSKQGTVSKMGFKDGPEAVAYLGFRTRGQSEYGCFRMAMCPMLIERLRLRHLQAPIASHSFRYLPLLRKRTRKTLMPYPRRSRKTTTTTMTSIWRTRAKEREGHRNQHRSQCTLPHVSVDTCTAHAWASACLHPSVVTVRKEIFRSFFDSQGE